MVEVVGFCRALPKAFEWLRGSGPASLPGRASAFPRVLALPGRHDGSGSAAVFSEARVPVTAPPEPTSWNAGP